MKKVDYSMIGHLYHLSLHRKLYFPDPGISWKAQKDEVNIIFTSTF